MSILYSHETFFLQSTSMFYVTHLIFFLRSAIEFCFVRVWPRSYRPPLLPPPLFRLSWLHRLCCAVAVWISSSRYRSDSRPVGNSPLFVFFFRVGFSFYDSTLEVISVAINGVITYDVMGKMNRFDSINWFGQMNRSYDSFGSSILNRVENHSLIIHNDKW